MSRDWQPPRFDEITSYRAQEQAQRAEVAEQRAQYQEAVNTRPQQQAEAKPWLQAIFKRNEEPKADWMGRTPLPTMA